MIHCEHAFLNNHRFSDFGCQRNVIANKHQLAQIGKSTLAIKSTLCAIQFDILSNFQGLANIFLKSQYFNKP